MNKDVSYHFKYYNDNLYILIVETTVDYTKIYTIDEQNMYIYPNNNGTDNIHHFLQFINSE